MEALQTLRDAALAHFPSCFISAPSDPQSQPPPWPTIVFLHGIGERGNDLALVTRHGLPKFCAAKQTEPFRSSFPFCVVAAQCPAEQRWIEPPTLERLEKLVQALSASPTVDERRIYLTGWSLGGCATWSLALRHPEWFAAIAPISSRCFEHDEDPEGVAACLGRLPLWIAYGLHDRQIDANYSTALIAALGDHPDIQVRVFTDENSAYDAEAHVRACEQAYSDPDLYAWLLDHVNERREQ